MNKLRHGVAGMCILVFLVIFFVNINDDLKSNYHVTDSDVKNFDGSDFNVMEGLKNLTLLSAITDLSTTMLSISTPGASLVDIAGGLIAIGIGTVKSVIGLAVFPGQIIGVIFGFYNGSFDGWIKTLIINIVMIYVGFIILSLYLGKDI